MKKTGLVVGALLLVVSVALVSCDVVPISDTTLEDQWNQRFQQKDVVGTWSNTSYPDLLKKNRKNLQGTVITSELTPLTQQVTEYTFFSDQTYTKTVTITFLDAFDDEYSYNPSSELDEYEWEDSLLGGVNQRIAAGTDPSAFQFNEGTTVTLDNGVVVAHGYADTFADPDSKEAYDDFAGETYETVVERGRWVYDELASNSFSPGSMFIVSGMTGDNGQDAFLRLIKEEESETTVPVNYSYGKVYAGESEIEVAAIIGPAGDVEDLIVFGQPDSDDGSQRIMIVEADDDEDSDVGDLTRLVYTKQ